MNRERRQFIHEYCEHFGCESESYDEEPKRNVVATAYRDRCWLPTLSVLQVGGVWWLEKVVLSGRYLGQWLHSVETRGGRLRLWL